MMNAPYMQAMMQSMAANPDLARNLLQQNPLYAANPQLGNQIAQVGNRALCLGTTQWVGARASKMVVF